MREDSAAAGEKESLREKPKYDSGTCRDERKPAGKAQGGIKWKALI